MPHKIYQCCDSNNCTCGSWDKQYGTSQYIEPDLARYSLNELKNEVKNREDKEKANKIKALKKEIERLEKD